MRPQRDDQVLEAFAVIAAADRAEVHLVAHHDDDAHRLTRRQPLEEGEEGRVDDARGHLRRAGGRPPDPGPEPD